MPHDVIDIKIADRAAVDRYRGVTVQTAGLIAASKKIFDTSAVHGNFRAARILTVQRGAVQICYDAAVNRDIGSAAECIGAVAAGKTDNGRIHSAFYGDLGISLCIDGFFRWKLVSADDKQFSICHFQTIAKHKRIEARYDHARGDGIIRAVFDAQIFKCYGTA